MAGGQLHGVIGQLRRILGDRDGLAAPAIRQQFPDEADMGADDEPQFSRAVAMAHVIQHLLRPGGPKPLFFHHCLTFG